MSGVRASSSSARNVLILGKTGSGKSSLGNALLRRQAFEVSSGMLGASVDTAAFQRAGGHQDGLSDGGPLLTVVEGPDLLPDGTQSGSRSERSQAVRKSLETAFEKFPELVEGFHLVLLTVRLDTRFTEEESRTLACIADALGDDGLARAAVVVFTHGDCIENDEARFREAVVKQRVIGSDISLGELIDRCAGRCCMVDAGQRCDSGAQLMQVQKLMKLVNVETVRPLMLSEMMKVSAGPSTTPHLDKEAPSSWLRTGALVTTAACILGIGIWLCKHELGTAIAERCAALSPLTWLFGRPHDQMQGKK